MRESSVGVDVSKENLSICIISKGRKKFLTIGNNEKSFDGFLSRYKIEETTPVIMEASGPYHVRFANHLYKRGYV